MIQIIRRQWNRWAVALVTGLALLSPLSAQNPMPIHTKNATLRLPVQIDERTRPQVAEVKLFVRQPNGPWRLVQTLPPTATAFDFKAETDGVYSFTFVTVDRRGKSDPTNLDVTPPHRIVVVDTKAPEVSAQIIPLRGERFLQVHVRDSNPDWTTLRVSFLAPDQTWQPLTVAAIDTPTVFRVPNPSVFESKIRVTAGDRAGNTVQREMDLGDPTANFGFNGKSTVTQGKPDAALIPKMEPSASDIRVPTLDAPTIRPVDYQEAIKIPEPIKSPESVKSPEPIKQTVIRNAPSELPPIPEVPPLSKPNLPIIRSGNRDPEIKLPEVPNILPPSISAKESAPKINEDLRIDMPSDVRAPIQTTSALKPIDLPKPANAPKPVELPKDVAMPTPPPIPEPIFEGKGPPTHTILNSRVLTINYQVEGARGTNRIDFWATPDGGKSWIALRDDSAGVAPAKLTLPADGFYGIRIRPGAGSRPPEVGEDPDCVVEIDSTKPTVNLMQPTLGTGSDEGTMLITWTASDKNLLSNSVNLFYSTKPEGPWEVIVSGYKNAGIYRWTMPTQLSGNIFVRLEVSDRAGNVGQHDLKSPVALEVLKPRVKVLGVGTAK